MLSRFSRRCYCTSVHRPWLFLGLGNLGDKYKGTRYNIGFEMIDVFAELVGIEMNLVNFKAIMGQGFVGDIPVILAKPQTYMNLSAIATLLKLIRVDLLRLITSYLSIVCLWCMMTRNCHVVFFVFRKKEAMDVTTGIWKPPGQMDPKAFLLQKFSMPTLEWMDGALAKGVDALKLVLSKDFAESWRLFNVEQKYKHLRQHSVLAA